MPRSWLPSWLHCWLLSLIASVVAASAACGQGDGLGDSFGAVGDGGNAAEQGNIVISAEFTAATDTTPARLFITAEIDPGWHTFSLTQPKGGPLASKITLVASEDYKLLAEDFTPAPAPEIKFTWPGKPDLPIEEHIDTVTWYVPIELASGVDPDKLTIEGKLRAQRCDETSACLPPKNFGFAARLGPGVEVPDEKPVAAAPEPATGDLPLDGLRNLINGGQAAEKPAPQGNIALSARFTQPDADGRAELLITADIEPGWHTFAVTQPKGGPVTTKITLAESDQYRLLADQFTPTPPPHVKHTWPKQPELAVEEHSGHVTWSAPIEIVEGVDPATLTIEGKVKAQRCDDGFKTCLPPHSFEFVAKLGASAAAIAAAQPPAPSDRGEPGGAATASPGGLDFNQINQHARRGELTLALRVVFAFLGGMLLNVMPCVLPVIGLKIMSFVQQSGHDRGKVFLLNVAYALGILAVFMLLAGLAVLAGLGWGDLFRRPAFVIGMTGIVFAMGLSLLGVWEIPIPGFAGGSKVNDLARQEGLSGAFYKGIITTILATPCTGPFLGSGIAVSAATPAYVTLISFAAAGLGMASPYILIGAFPKLIRFLPKPGEWMDTFKQCMGFLMLGAVVYFLTTIPATAVIPTVALLIGLWAACWWIGRTPITAETGEKTRAWLWAGAFAVAIGWLAFGWLQPEMIARQDRTTQRKIDVAVNEALAEFQALAGGPVDGGARDPGALPHQGESELAWQPFTKARLEQLTRDQKTVLVDFTADWCLVCQVLAGTVLNTEDTRQLVEANGVVPLLADWTNYESDQEVDAMLEALGSKQVPTLAIFPAGRPNEPIVIRGTYTKARLAELLKQAGPSKAVASRPKGRSAAVTKAHDELAWEPYTRARLEQLTAERKTVMVDFTADWCGICLVLSGTVLKSDEVREQVEANGVVPLLADWTNREESTEVDALLTALGSKLLPTLAIFPAGRPNEPIVVRGPYTAAQLADWIREAAGAASDEKPTVLSPQVAAGLGEPILLWQRYSNERLESLCKSGRTVLVNVTADWSTYCQVLEATVLNTSETSQLVEELGIVPLQADWTEQSKNAEIDVLKAKLGRMQTPLLAIFPAARPDKPIILPGMYTKEELAARLREAGPSKSVANDNLDDADVASGSP